MTIRPPRTWPSCTSLAVVLCLHAMMVGSFLLHSSQANADAAFADCPPLWLVIGATGYGIQRVRKWHPVLGPGYRSWLEQTPWTSSKPLPLGPVHLVGADVALLLCAFLAAWPFWGVSSSLIAVQAFLGAYTLTLMVALLATREWAAGYVSWFGVASMLYSRGSGWPFYVIAAATYGIEQWGFRRSLKRFPWGFKWRSLKELIERNQRKPLQAAMAVGWPFGYLHPKDNYLSISRLHGVSIAFLSGWTAYVQSSLFASSDWVTLAPLFLVPLLYAPLLRLLIYGVFQHRPPISLAGRLRTGRLIIPSYDQVFVAPLLAAVALLQGFWLPGWVVESNLAAFSTVGLAAFSLLVIGPDRRSWLLTAETRIAPPRILTFGRG